LSPESGPVALLGAGRTRWQQLADERVFQPVLVLAGRPASVADEQPVDLRGHKNMDNVRRIALAQARLQGAGARERTGDLLLALIPVARLSGKQRGGVRIRTGCAEQDPVDGLGPGHDTGGDACEACELVSGIGILMASSSPATETSSSALRIPSLDENSRYTVAAGTSDCSLMASIVVAA
jgi:hypothetical protein